MARKGSLGPQATPANLTPRAYQDLSPVSTRFEPYVHVPGTLSHLPYVSHFRSIIRFRGVTLHGQLLRFSLSGTSSTVVIHFVIVLYISIRITTVLHDRESENLMGGGIKLADA